MYVFDEWLQFRVEIWVFWVKTMHIWTNLSHGSEPLQSEQRRQLNKRHNHAHKSQGDSEDDGQVQFHWPWAPIPIQWKQQCRKKTPRTWSNDTHNEDYEAIIPKWKYKNTVQKCEIIFTVSLQKEPSAILQIDSDRLLIPGLNLHGYLAEILARSCQDLGAILAKILKYGTHVSMVPQDRHVSKKILSQKTNMVLNKIRNFLRISDFFHWFQILYKWIRPSYSKSIEIAWSWFQLQWKSKMHTIWLENSAS